MLKKNGFEILIVSPFEYERLIAEIYCDGLNFAVISHERSEGLFDIELPDPDFFEGSITKKVDLEGILGAVDRACKCLLGEE